MKMQFPFASQADIMQRKLALQAKYSFVLHTFHDFYHFFVKTS